MPTLGLEVKRALHRPHLINELECLVIHVIGQTLHHVGAAPGIHHLRRRGRSQLDIKIKYMGINNNAGKFDKLVLFINKILSHMITTCMKAHCE